MKFWFDTNIFVYVNLFVYEYMSFLVIVTPFQAQRLSVYVFDYREFKVEIW